MKKGFKVDVPDKNGPLRLGVIDNHEMFLVEKAIVILKSIKIIKSLAIGASASETTLVF